MMTEDLSHLISYGKFIKVSEEFECDKLRLDQALSGD